MHGFRILGGRLRGARIYTSAYDYPGAILGTTEHALLEWFEGNVKLGETWLDVGAHYGYTTIALARAVGKRGSVIAFEPMLSTAGFLSHTVRKNNLQQVTVLPFALTDVSELGMGSTPEVRGMIDTTVASENEASYLECSLDWLWARTPGLDHPVNGIKIDVQGMELRTVRGMRQVLQRHRPKLVVELHGGVDRSELLSYLEELGYQAPAASIEHDQVGVGLAVDDVSYVFLPPIRNAR